MSHMPTRTDPLAGYNVCEMPGGGYTRISEKNPLGIVLDISIGWTRRNFIYETYVRDDSGGERKPRKNTISLYASGDNGIHKVRWHSGWCEPTPLHGGWYVKQGYLHLHFNACGWQSGQSDDRTLEDLHDANHAAPIHAWYTVNTQAIRGPRYLKTISLSAVGVSEVGDAAYPWYFEGNDTSMNRVVLKPDGKRVLSAIGSTDDAEGPVYVWTTLESMRPACSFRLPDSPSELAPDEAN